MIPLILSLDDPDLLQSGIFPGFNPAAVPLWADGENVSFRNNAAERLASRKEVTTVTSGVITGIAQARVSGTNRVYVGNVTEIFKYDASVSSLGSGFGGGNWSFVPWGSWLLATNGVDPVQVWKNTGSLANLAGPGFTSAEILIKRGTHLLAFNTSAGEEYMNWCASDDVEEWTDTNLGAGQKVLRDLDGPVLAAAKIGDQIGVYTRDSLHLVSYLGTPFWFGSRPALNGIGAVGKNVIVSVARRNFGLSDTGFFETDGASFRYIDDAVRDWFLDNINVDYISTVNAWHNEKKKEVVWYFPTGAATRPDAGLAYNYAKQAWMKLDYGMDASIEKQVYDYPLAGYGTGIFWQEIDTGAGLETITGWLQSKPSAAAIIKGAVQNLTSYYKYLDSVRVDFKNTTDATTVDLYIGTSDVPTGTITWNGPYAVSPDSPWAYPRLSSPYFSLKITGTDKWSVNNIQAFGEVAGEI